VNTLINIEFPKPDVVIRQRIKKHFEDNVSPMKNYRDEVFKIEVYEVEDPMEREIYETYAINTFRSKYNVDKVFY